MLLPRNVEMARIFFDFKREGDRWRAADPPLDRDGFLLQPALRDVPNRSVAGSEKAS